MKSICYIVALTALVSCNSVFDKHKIHKTYYPSGKLQSTTETIDDIKDGEERMYFESGKLFMVQHFKKNLPVDSFFQYANDSNNSIILRGICTPRVHAKIYDSEGKLFSESDFVENAVSDGFTKLYFKNGTVAAISEHKQNRADGIYVSYHHNGKLRSIIQYRNDSIQSQPIYFDTTGRQIPDDH